MKLELGSMNLNDLIGGVLYYDSNTIEPGIIINIEKDPNYDIAIITTSNYDKPWRVPFLNNKLFSSYILKIKLNGKDLIFRY